MIAYAPSGLFVLAGILLVLSGAALPEYSDPDWQEHFFDGQVTLENSDALSAEWYEAKAVAQTPRNARLDLGTGLMALGAAVALLFAILRFRSLGDIRFLRTPRTHRTFYVCSALTWLSFIPATWFWLYYTMRRGDYPPWADTIAIPAAGVLFVGIAGLPVVLAGAWVALRGSRLPVRLWSLPAFGPPYVVGVGLSIAALLALLVLYSALTSEPFMVPSALFTLYLVLSGRAAAVVRGCRRARS